MKATRGFTLIEVLVAVLIAAIIAAMSSLAMRQALAGRERVRAAATRLTAVQTAVRELVQDFSQLEPRPVRQPLGEGYLPALTGSGGDTAEVVFTRTGWMNPAGGQRSTLQRVRYTLRDNALYRDYWTVLDAQLQPEPVSRQLLDGVKLFRVRYMNDGRDWQDDWPPTSSVRGANSERELRWRPLAVEVTLELDDLGTITRVIEAAG